MDVEIPQSIKPGLGIRILQFPLTRLILGVLLVLGAVIIGKIIMAIGGRLIFAAGEFPDWWKMIDFLLNTILAILGYMFYVRKIEKRELHELGRSGFVKELGIGGSIGAGLMTSVVLTLWMLGYYRVTAVSGLAVLLLPFFDMTFTGFFEELLFRGIIFRIINNSLGTWIAMILSALIFGFAHAVNPNATPFSSIAIALEAGILLSAAYLYTRRLWMVIGIHFAWNFVLGGIFSLTVSGQVQKNGLLQSQLEGPALLTGGSFGPETSLITIIICLLVGLFFLLKVRQRGHFTRPSWRRIDKAEGIL